MTGSRVSIATSENRRRPSWVPIWRASRNSRPACRDGIDIRETLRNWHTGEPVRQGDAPEPRIARGRGLSVRHPGRPANLCEPNDLVRRAFRGIDPGLLRHRSHEKPGRAGDRPGRNTAVPSSSFRRGRSPTSGSTSGSISPIRWKNGCSPRRFCTAATSTSRSSAPRFLPRAGGGWLASSAVRSSICRSSGSAASFSSGCARFTCSTASTCGLMRRILFGTCDPWRPDAPSPC